MQNRMLRLLAIGLGVLCIGGASVKVIAGQSSYHRSVSERNAQIAELSEELDGLSDVSVDASGEDANTDASEVLRRAEAAAEKIGALENEYQALLFQERENPGEEAAFISRQEKIWDVFDTMFGEGSLLRTPWYDGADGLEGASWKAMANYRFSGTKVPVVWTLYGKDGLFAYVSAVYDASSDTFSKPVKCITSLGNAMYAFTGSDTQRDAISKSTAGIFSIIDQVNEGDLPDNRIPYTEEENEQRVDDDEARQKALDAMKEKANGGGR